MCNAQFRSSLQPSRLCSKLNIDCSPGCMYKSLTPTPHLTNPLLFLLPVWWCTVKKNYIEIRHLKLANVSNNGLFNDGKLLHVGFYH